MEIIVENGSGVVNSNSYVTTTEFKEYASSRGETIPDEEESQKALLLQAMDYLQYQYQYKGNKTYPELELEFPRTGLTQFGFAKDQIPRVIQVAQMRLAIISFTEDLFPVSGSGTVREKVDVIEVQYSDTGSTGRFSSPLIDSMLGRMVTGSGLGAIQTLRVVRA